MKARKHSPEITTEKGSDGRTMSERKPCPLPQPDISLLQPSAFTTPYWTVLSSTSGDNHMKRQKLLKKESLVNFWDVKAGCVPALWWGRGAGQAGAFARAMRCRRPAGLHHQARCCHSTSRCLGFSIWKMGGNDIYLPQEGLNGLASMCVEHSNGSWTLLLLYTPVYVTDRLVCGETSTSVSTRHNYTACNVIKRNIFPLKEKKKSLSWALLIIITH